MKLGLGTVQFGLDYGVTNDAGRTPLEAVRHILNDAQAQGVTVLDTAALYGDSEAVLGQTLPRPHNFRIITKTLALDHGRLTEESVGALRAGVERSLQRLGETRLAGLLVHRPEDLLAPQSDALFRMLSKLRDEGIVEKIGVSAYTGAEIEAILERYPMDLVQLPLNPLDQRPLERGALAKLIEQQVEIHIRSAFLQGLLVTPLNAIPPRLSALVPALYAWHSQVALLNLPPMEVAFGFLKSVAGIDTVVCGAVDATQWDEIQATFARAKPLPLEMFKNLAVQDDKLVDPRHWPKAPT